MPTLGGSGDDTHPPLSHCEKGRKLSANVVRQPPPHKHTLSLHLRVCWRAVGRGDQLEL
jgi:hypothetical protein